MKSRERVKKAISAGKVDRIPHFLPDGKENDLIWLWMDKPAPLVDWTNDGDQDFMTDCWGVSFKRMAGGVLGRGEVSEAALKDISKQEDFPFPDLNNPIYLQKAADIIKDNELLDDPKYCLGVMPFSSMNEGIHNITGIESMFLAYYEDPDQLKALIARFAAAQRESMRQLKAIGCDGVMAYDDWGLQNSLMISLDMIREFFLPHYRENWAYAHELGMDVWLHSCGYILELLPDLIDAGLNVVQMDQQENMGIENLADKVDGKLSFWCPVDIQRTMVEGTNEDIDLYVKRMVETLGRNHNGLISMAYTTPDDINHTAEKIKIMCDAFRRYGKY
ncbi:MULTISPECIES: uroporphyrinogen decarboxylase family protein [unclassified Oceanispirochaeta]|uniref:uroporphyrinogen decarboxylase family protein n=1 Tax=unclassified Oceanispirochaeta TaxID=2635722 RepID=UPI001314AB56|nr:MULTISPECIES: uroporphyrinogen decarboxylase family protein [unclassified Oceanispirochaeta]MBF9018401.1 hypothetical protein [Oceanispirochaeta sp. M2]NPD75213.1 hypothetical protein [Oceanispirochaeta sp. M1]